MKTTASQPLIIPAPRLGLLNLLGDAAQTLVEQDERAFGRLFNSTTHSVDRPPQCDVLVAYLQLQEDGAVAACSDTLESLVWASGAPIVLIASPNSDTSYIKATQWLSSSVATHGGSINLVMTLDRAGLRFGNFFGKLFSQMKDGVTMPMAWVAQAPQNPQAQHDAPSTIFFCGAGHIAFARRPSLLDRVFGRR